MKTTNYLTLTGAIFLMLSVLTACQTGAKNSTPNPVVPTSTTNGNQPTSTKAEAVSPGSLSSPTEAYKTAYAARQKKDAKALQQTMSKKMLSFMADMGKAEKKTLEDELKEMIAAPLPATNEVRNEKIAGDKATVKYPDDNGKWKAMDFEKEGNDWKLSLPSTQPTIVQDTTKKQ